MTKTNPHIPPRPRHAAFTIIELLVVIVIILVVVGLGVPAMNSVINDSQVDTAATVVSNAASAARAYATRSKADLDPPITGAQYSGAAIIITPQGEMRLVENNQQALASNSPIVYLESIERNGYTDIPNRDYLRIPSGAAVVGLVRSNGEDPTGLKLLTPPFAIRFDQNGSLETSTFSALPYTTANPGEPRIVHYDANYDGIYNVTGADGSYRGNSYGPGSNNYNPDHWDPSRDDYIGTGSPNNDETKPDPHRDSNRYKLPFERLETVVGVVVYSDKDFRRYLTQLNLPNGLPMQAVFNDSSTDVQKARDWLLTHGQVIMFNRYTGGAIK